MPLIEGITQSGTLECSFVFHSSCTAKVATF